MNKIKRVYVDGTCTVVEMDNGHKIREGSVTALLLADIRERMIGEAQAEGLRALGLNPNVQLIKKVEGRIISARVKKDGEGDGK